MGDHESTVEISVPERDSGEFVRVNPRTVRVYPRCGNNIVDTLVVHALNDAD